MGAACLPLNARRRASGKGTIEPRGFGRGFVAMVYTSSTSSRRFHPTSNGLSNSPCCPRRQGHSVRRVWASMACDSPFLSPPLGRSGSLVAGYRHLWCSGRHGIRAKPKGPLGGKPRAVQACSRRVRSRSGEASPTCLARALES
jgi:hypothetical protein